MDKASKLAASSDNKVSSNDVDTSSLRHLIRWLIEDRNWWYRYIWTIWKQSAEIQRRNDALAASTETDPNVLFDLWYTEYTRIDKYRLARWPPELLDELCLLLEHVRANRRAEDDAPSATPALPPAQGSLYPKGTSSDY